MNGAHIWNEDKPIYAKWNKDFECFVVPCDCEDYCEECSGTLAKRPCGQCQGVPENRMRHLLELPQLHTGMIDQDGCCTQCHGNGWHAVGPLWHNLKPHCIEIK